jgi:hypothetical protein
MAETDHLILGQITTDHSFRQTRLKGLVDDAAVSCEINAAALHKSAECKVLRNAASLGVKNPDRRVRPKRSGCVTEKLYFPNALASVAAVLF